MDSIYSAYEYIPHLNYAYLDYCIENQRVYVSQEATDKIAVYDIQGNRKQLFGERARYFSDRGFMTSSTKEDYDRSFQETILYQNRYAKIYHDPFNNLTLRWYWPNDTPGINVFTFTDSVSVLQPSPNFCKVYLQKKGAKYVQVYDSSGSLIYDDVSFFDYPYTIIQNDKYNYWISTKSSSRSNGTHVLYGYKISAIVRRR
ncbi:MAG: hypothetical protein IH948_08885 [Bacteroidetes bacterium]|nr:hypothetical protein [Bacteroidota bacterium]